jgi:sterol desaturase/sphingolipid hydroxylase (fatty acid hydroxylase superfamily)
VNWYTSAAFVLFLLLCAAGLMAWHVRAWRAQRLRKLEPNERDFLRRQFRRRMQTSAMLALIAATLPVGQWLVQMGAENKGTNWPKWAIAFWGLVILLVVWVGFLALADLWATRLFFGRLRHRYWLEKTRLEAELRRIHGAGGNGKPPGDSGRKGPELKDQGPEA